MFYCKYCNKECKNLNSLRQHKIRCKQNPNKILPSGCFTKNHIGYNHNWEQKIKYL